MHDPYNFLMCEAQKLTKLPPTFSRNTALCRVQWESRGTGVNVDIKSKS